MVKCVREYDWAFVVAEVTKKISEDEDGAVMDLVPVALCAIEAHCVGGEAGACAYREEGISGVYNQ